MVSTKINFVLDALLLVAFLLILSPHLTGNLVHEWMGFALAVAVILHLLFHWDWIVNVGRTFFKKLWCQSRLNFVIGLLFFIALTGSFFSGLLISDTVMAVLDIRLDVNDSWKFIHQFISEVSVLLLGIHSALHWKFIVMNIRRYALPPISGVF